MRWVGGESGEGRWWSRGVIKLGVCEGERCSENGILDGGVD